MRIVVGGPALVTLLWCGFAIAQSGPSVPESPANDPRLSGAGTTKIPIAMPGSTEVMGAETAATSAPPATIALEHPIDPDSYVCGAGDTFELNFWGQQN